MARTADARPTPDHSPSAAFLAMLFCMAVVLGVLISWMISATFP
jgi:hypothetical protein